MSDKYYKGLPSMLMLSAVDYAFSSDSIIHTIELPIRGKYSEVGTSAFIETDDFELFNEESRSIDLPAVTKVMLACSKYPDLLSNQAFIPISIAICDNVLRIKGQVLSFVKVGEDQ